MVNNQRPKTATQPEGFLRKGAQRTKPENEIKSFIEMLKVVVRPERYLKPTLILFDNMTFVMFLLSPLSSGGCLVRGRSCGSLKFNGI